MASEQSAQENKINKWRDHLDNGELPEVAEHFLIDRLVECDAFERIIADLDSSNTELEIDHHVYRWQASVAFLAALALMTVGLVLILSFIASNVLGYDPVSARLIASAGIVTEVVAALPFWFWLRASGKLDETSRQLKQHRDLLQAAHLASSLPSHRRAAAIESVIKQLVSNKVDVPRTSPC